MTSKTERMFSARGISTTHQQNRICVLDNAIGHITEWNFKLEAPNWVITKRLDQESGESETARVALSTLVS